ncbi:MAG TPA: hypothetical protein VHY79_09835 [Rhizomicrobium sp.]|nr:hypothetical protein [Rhizomicrobium sp.]
MKLIVFVTSCVFAWSAARADDAARCHANDGTFLTGRVTGGPTFSSGGSRDGVELSHTHVTLLSDQDGQSYNVAVDNVFAAGYDAAGEGVPAPLSTVRVGNRLEVCGGRPYTDHGTSGIDWVHTNCGATPASGKPNGWFKVLAADGTPCPNLEASPEYCRLWQ